MARAVAVMRSIWKNDSAAKYVAATSATVCAVRSATAMMSVAAVSHGRLASRNAKCSGTPLAVSADARATRAAFETGGNAVGSAAATAAMPPR